MPNSYYLSCEGGRLDEIKSLARGLKLLDMLAQSDNGAGATELAEQLGVDKSSAFRLLQTLARYGYVEQDDDTRRYYLGPQVVALSRSILTRMPLRDQAKPFLRQLVERTGECAHLAIPAQGRALYIDQVESPATLSVNTGVGTLAPLHCTALGKALLAYGAEPIPHELRFYTPRTITDPAALRAHLEQTRRQGYAIDDEEYAPGVRCVAVPVWDYRGKVVGAIGISGPVGRMDQERLPDLAGIVLEVGKALSDRLSFKRA